MMGVTTWESGDSAPSRRRPTGFRERSPQRCGDFFSFFPRNKAFSSIFWS